MSTARIAFVGLTRWSAALAQGLAGRSEARRVLYADDPELARDAQKNGAFTASDWNLISAIDGAQVVVTSGPVARQAELITAFAAELAPEASVVALTPVFGPILATAAALPAGRGLAAAHPLFDPALQVEAEPDWRGAKGDDFANGAWLLASAPGAGADTALALAGQLARAVKAQACYFDPAEHDLAAAGAEGAPQLLATALLAAASRPGWHELRRAADRGFATATRAVDNATAGDWLANRDALTGEIDALTAELTRLRAALQSHDEATLAAALDVGQRQRAAWLQARASSDWDPSSDSRTLVPSLSETLGRMLFGGLGRKK
jgi:prephenate dehydrogenase